MKLGKLLFIFIVLIFGFYFLCCGLLGQNGYMYNKSLKELLIQKEYMNDKISIELNSLIQRQISLANDEGLRDIAIKYYVDGDNVYLFSDTSESETVFAGNIHDTEVELFVPYSKPLCLAVALVPAALITFTVWFISYISNRDYSSDDKSDKEQIKYDNSSIDDFRE